MTQINEVRILFAEVQQYKYSFWHMTHIQTYGHDIQ